MKEINYKRLYEELKILIFYEREVAIYTNKKRLYNALNDIINYIDEQEDIENRYVSAENEDHR